MNNSIEHHHVLIAGAQLWPNINGLLLLDAQNRAPSHIHILHTNNRYHSAEPAKRLRLLVSSHLAPASKCTLHELTDEMSQTTTHCIREILDAAPLDALKTINTTGGLKPIFAGLSPFLHSEDIETLYTDLNGDWWCFKQADDDTHSLKSTKLEIASFSAKHIPLIDLINVQADTRGTNPWKADHLPKIPGSKILDVFIDAIESAWEWGTLHARHKWLVLGKNTQSGYLFEQFFAAIVKHYLENEDQGQMNLLLPSEDDKQHLEELDIAVNTGHAILILDLKLTQIKTGPNEDARIVDQFAKVAKACERLGGLGAKGVLVRPSWNRNDQIVNLERGFRLTVWTADEMPRMLTLLADQLGKNIPYELEKLEKIILEKDANSHRIFSTPDPIRRANETSGEKEHKCIAGLIDLAKHSQYYLEKNTPYLVRIDAQVAAITVNKWHVDNLNLNEPSQLNIGNKVSLQLISLYKGRDDSTSVVFFILLKDTEITTIRRALDEVKLRIKLLKSNPQKNVSAKQITRKSHSEKKKTQPTQEQFRQTTELSPFEPGYDPFRNF